VDSYRDANPEELLSRARAGQGYGELLESYRNYVRFLARLQIGWRLQGKLDASDVAQETFLQAHRTFSQFRGVTETEFLHWLRQVLAHVLSNMMRRYFGTQQRDVRLECELDRQLDRTSKLLSMGLLDRQKTPSKSAIRREQAVLLADALEQLPQKRRDIVVMRHMESLSFPEIAERLGCSLDAVKTHWRHALVDLRNALGDAM
jgi:RNA polymerase sigma-70 factor (ECF subfamily)